MQRENKWQKVFSGCLELDAEKSAEFDIRMKKFIQQEIKNKCEAEVKKAIEERDKEIVEKITKIKETVREQTGSFKYDNQYDDCINLITSGNYVKVGDRYYRLENCELKELTNK